VPDACAASLLLPGLERTVGLASVIRAPGIIIHWRASCGGPDLASIGMLLPSIPGGGPLPSTGPCIMPGGGSPLHHAGRRSLPKSVPAGSGPLQKQHQNARRAGIPADAAGTGHR